MLTIGHSTRGLDEFVRLLKAHGVTRIVDVRTVPRSRHNPQFNGDTLPRALQDAGIGYTHMKGLGGLRRARDDSPNTGWRNEGFRGYADYIKVFGISGGPLMLQGARGAFPERGLHRAKHFSGRGS